MCYHGIDVPGTDKKTEPRSAEFTKRLAAFVVGLREYRNIISVCLKDS